MRRCLWIALAILIVVSGATPAHADTSFVYTVVPPATLNPTQDEVAFTTLAIPLADVGVLLPASDLSSFSLIGSNWAGCTLAGVTLNAGLEGTVGNTGVTFGGSEGCGGFISAVFTDGFAAADYSTPGTYVGAFDTMVVTAVQQTPEPDAGLLMLVGIGFLFAMGRRFVKSVEAS